MTAHGRLPRAGNVRFHAAQLDSQVWARRLSGSTGSYRPLAVARPRQDRSAADERGQRQRPPGTVCCPPAYWSGSTGHRTRDAAVRPYTAARIGAGTRSSAWILLSTFRRHPRLRMRRNALLLLTKQKPVIRADASQRMRLLSRAGPFTTSAWRLPISPPRPPCRAPSELIATHAE